MRTEQLFRVLERQRGYSRRELLRLGAVGIPLLAGFARLAAPRAARADNGSPISKPLPPQYFVTFGSNAEMRWDAVAGLGYEIPNDRFFVRDHTGTPIIVTQPESEAAQVFAKIAEQIEAIPPRKIYKKELRLT